MLFLGGHLHVSGIDIWTIRTFTHFLISLSEFRLEVELGTSCPKGSWVLNMLLLFALAKSWRRHLFELFRRCEPFAWGDFPEVADRQLDELPSSDEKYGPTFGDVLPEEPETTENVHRSWLERSAIA